MSYTIQYIPARTGMLAGMGVNMMTGQATTDALTIQTTGSPNPSSHTTSSCIRTAQDYSQLLSLVASAEGSAWTEDGEVSMSASAGYLSSRDFTAQTLALTVYRSCTTYQSLPTPAQLQALQLPAAMAQMILQNPQGFLSEYGTHVIVGFIDGGSFLAGITVSTVSAQDMTAVEAAFSSAVNAFELGKGALDSTLQASLNSYQSTYTCNTLSTSIGANPPVFNVSDIGAMQDYLNNQFVTQLGTGVPLQAVCYPWEMLPCVANLAGYQPGSLSPSIDMGAVAILQTEYQQLAYGIQTAKGMQQNNCFAGPQAQADLQQDLEAMTLAQAAIAGLTFQELQTITAANVNSYVVSPLYINDLQQIANGRTTLLWYISLDGAFTPNSQNTPTKTINGSSNTVLPTATATPQTVLTSSHGDGDAVLGYIYQVSGATPGTQLQNMAQLSATFSFRGATYVSASPIDGTQWNSAVNANWPAYPWNAMNVYFGSGTSNVANSGAFEEQKIGVGASGS